MSAGTASTYEILELIRVKYDRPTLSSWSVSQEGTDFPVYCDGASVRRANPTTVKTLRDVYAAISGRMYAGESPTAAEDAFMDMLRDSKCCDPCLVEKDEDRALLYPDDEVVTVVHRIDFTDAPKAETATVA